MSGWAEPRAVPTMHIHVCFDGRPTINTGPATGQGRGRQATTASCAKARPVYEILWAPAGGPRTVWVPVGYPTNASRPRTESCWGTQNCLGTRGVPNEC